MAGARDHLTMSRRTPRLAVSVVVLAAAASLVVGAVHAADANPVGPLQARPVVLPTVSPGACPVTKRLVHVSWNALPFVQGDGPVALMIVPPVDEAAIDVGGWPVDTLGYVGQKTPWEISMSYRGPLLIRGRRLDGSSPIRFAHGTGDHLTELWWPNVDQLKNHYHGWYGLPSSTLVRKVGCYGFQLDGTNFSEHIIVRVLRK
jgi:hypothetical protein